MTTSPATPGPSAPTYRRAWARVLTQELTLDRPPIGLAFVQTRPEGVALAPGPVPSACTFWRLAESGIFYAEGTDHRECPVGALTMGFEPDAEGQSAAQTLVATMAELGYFGMDEVAHLPQVAKPHRGIVYGPLGELPIHPDVVMVIATPAQAMLLAEAGEAVTLGPAPALSTMGRPACSAVAWVANTAATTLSVGCIGARTYVEVPDDRAIVVLPGATLEPLVGRLTTIARANRVLSDYHRGRKAELIPTAPVPTPSPTAPS